jgi:p-hydroxybenzoate 3-monooxygenase
MPLEQKAEDCSNAAFWEELKRRPPEEAADTWVTGPAVNKSVAPLRSFVNEPMQWGRHFLCDAAAHIVPPTGAKGLNLAVSDVHYLSQALIRHYQNADDAALTIYSQTALARVWKAIRFSWWMTTHMHRFPGQTDFEQRIQESEIDYIAQSPAAQSALAENYTWLPY